MNRLVYLFTKGKILAVETNIEKFSVWIQTRGAVPNVFCHGKPIISAPPILEQKLPKACLSIFVSCDDIFSKTSVSLHCCLRFWALQIVDELLGADGKID